LSVVKTSSTRRINDFGATRNIVTKGVSQPVVTPVVRKNVIRPVDQPIVRVRDYQVTMLHTDWFILLKLYSLS
jgi:hypothetical protein